MLLKVFLPLVLGLASLIGVGDLIHGCVNKTTGAIRIVSYSKYGGIVVGYANSAMGDYSSVSGGSCTEVSAFDDWNADDRCS